MVESPIAVFDSGVGGLPYLEAVRRLLPNHDYVYAADRAGFPYGRKNRPEVLSRVLECVDSIVERFAPSHVVLACNTASQAALSAARCRHPGISFVGTVPAVKPAVERTVKGNVAVLSTDQAAVDPYLDALVERYARGVRVHRIGAQDLVEFLEYRFLDASEEERFAACEAALRPVRDSGADCVVLACTHFLHAASYIARAAGPSVLVVDSREGVARRVAELVKTRGQVSGTARRGDAYATGGPEDWGSLPRYAERFGLEFRGAL